MLVFDDGIMYLFKNRKKVDSTLNGLGTIKSHIDVIDKVKTVRLTEERINELQICTLIYKLLTVVTDAFDEDYDGFIIEGLRVKPLVMKTKMKRGHK